MYFGSLTAPHNWRGIALLAATELDEGTTA
jgi:hypothetical protein